MELKPYMGLKPYSALVPCDRGVQIMDETGRFREEQFAKLRLSFGPAEGDAAAAPGAADGPASTSGRGGGGRDGGPEGGGRWGGRGRDGGRGRRAPPCVPRPARLRLCSGHTARREAAAPGWEGQAPAPPPRGGCRCAGTAAGAAAGAAAAGTQARTSPRS